MKIVIISADFPNYISGIGDYTYKICNHFKNKYDNIVVITTDKKSIIEPDYVKKTNWNIFYLKRALNIIKGNNCLVVFQYPGVLYGKYNIYPYIFFLILKIMHVKIILTVHEYSNLHIMKRLLSLSLLLCAHKIVVSNKYEKEHLKFFQKKIAIINIFPNIEIKYTLANQESRTIAHFGMIYPDKKNEDVIKIMQIIDNLFPNIFVFRFIVGQHSAYSKYFFKIREKVHETLKRIEWYQNLDLSMVGEKLKNTFLSVQLYNDGVSLRRGSFLTIVSGGIPLISNEGIPEIELAKIKDNGMFCVNSDESIYKLINKLLNNRDYYNVITSNLIEFSKKYSFDKTISAYEELIDSIK